MENIQGIIVDFAEKVKDILGNNLSKIILYGSYARGEQRDNSDVDFMILTTLTEDELEKIEPILYDLVFEFELNYCIDISVIVNNEKHYHYWLGALPFYNNIEREGVVING